MSLRYSCVCKLKRTLINVYNSLNDCIHRMTVTSPSSTSTSTIAQHEEQSDLYIFRGTANCITNATDAEIKADILQNFQPSNGSVHRQIAANLRLTKNWETCFPAPAIGETSCPYHVAKSTLPRVNRLPDAIAIGAGKCGTGSLAFLDCHPDIRFRNYEPNAYSRDRHFEENFECMQFIRLCSIKIKRP